MKISISHPTKENININLGQFTQIIGHDQQIKHYMWQVLSWYFGGKKYSEDDLSIFDQEEPKITVDDTLIKRNEYKILTLSSLEDIINQMSYKKGTLAFDFIKNKLNSIDVIEQVEGINHHLEKIALLVNKHLSCDIHEMSYQINSVDFTVDQLLSKNFVPKFKVNQQTIPFEFVNNIDKILLMIHMLDDILSENMSKIILVMKNMDDYLTHNEFIQCCQLFNQLCEKFSHFNIIIFPSNEGYLYISESNIEYINIISDRITHYYDLDFMYDRFIVNYPNNSVPTKDEFLLLLQKNSNYLFTNHLEYISLSAEDLVTIKILNSLYQYDKKLKIQYKVPDTMTINFLRENFDIIE